MGQLVFQATLGGQVNLVGPNTASTFNINVPAVAGNMVTTGDTGTVTSTMLSTTTLTASASTTASSNKGAFNYGTLNFNDTGIVASYQTSVNSYFQNVIQNTNNGTAASSEFIAYNDQGTATTNFAAMGINSSGYTGTGSINAPGYAYFLSGSTDLVLGTIGSNKIHFTVNSGATDAMLIDTSGNVGVGVTPSAWNSAVKALQVNNAALSSFTSGGNVQTWLTNNAYYDAGGWKYKVSSVGANQYSQIYDGSHAWFTAPSGTANNAITFTQAMTLDASGNLSVGTTTASTAGGSYQAVTVNGSSGSNLALNGGGTGIGLIYAATGNSNLYVTNQTASGNLIFGTGSGNERARIDSSGRFYVYGTTNVGVNTSGGFYVDPLAGATYTTTSHVNGTASGNAYSNFFYNNSIIGSITQSGTTATLYNVTSDQRLKENIQDADSASSLIDSLQVRKFDWKSDNSHQRYGFVAQELVTVAPEAVHQPTDTEQMMAVDYSKLVPMLVKEIQSLRQRLAAAGI